MKLLTILLAILLTGCVNTSATTTVSNISKDQYRCPNSTKVDPINFVLIVLDKKGLPVDAIVPSTEVNSVDLRKTKDKFISLKRRVQEVQQQTKVCFRAVERTSKTPSGYMYTKQKIALLWQPSKHIEFKYTVIEEIPKNSPIDIGYKYTVATLVSTPRNGNTYLDPRIVVRKRL